MKSSLFIAAMFAATTASAQSSLLLPNNSAGTEMDTPPVLPGTPKVLEPSEPRGDAPIDFVIRDEPEQLSGPKEPDAADRNQDGRQDTNEPKALQEPVPLK